MYGDSRGYGAAQVVVRLAWSRESDPARRHAGVKREHHFAGRRDIEAVDAGCKMMSDGGHRIGLDRVVKLDPVRQRLTQCAYARTDQRPVVCKKRRASGARSKTAQVDAAHLQHAALCPEGIHHASFSDIISSPRSALRSNLPLGLRGRPARTSIRCGTI